MTEGLLTGLIILAAIGFTAWLLNRLYPDALPRLAITAGRKNARLSPGVIQVDGLEWHYLAGGPADAEAVVLVHGFGTDKDSWLLYARELTKSYRVIAPDMPGFGDTQYQPGLDYTTRPQAKRLLEFTRALGLQRFHMAGMSMGGHIAAHFALYFPDQLTSLTLIDNAGVNVPENSELVELVNGGTNPLAVSTMQELDAMLDLVTYKPMKIPGFMKRYVLKQMAANFEHVDRIFWAIVADSPDSFINEQLGGMKIPVLIVWGRQDRLIHISCAELMAQQIPDNELVILEECGHSPIIEHPESAAGAHARFMAARKQEAA